MEDYKKKYEDLVKNFGCILNLNTVKESGVISVDDVKHLIPELKESEDEIIRKTIINGLKHDIASGQYKTIYGVNLEDVLVWFEKQKPDEWTDEDDKMVDLLITIFEVNYPDGFYKVNPINTPDMKGIHTHEIVKWLKSINSKKQNSRGEIEKKDINETCEYLTRYANSLYNTNEEKATKVYKLIDKLKSIKPFELKRQGEWVDCVVDILDWAEENGRISYSDYIDYSIMLTTFKPRNCAISEEEFKQAKKDAFNEALDKIEYHSGEPTFDDGWSAAVSFILKKYNINKVVSYDK